MKIFVKPSLILILCLVLGSIGIFFLPIAKIQYQIIDESQSYGKDSMVVSAIGYARAYGDKYGLEAFPCEFPGFDLPSSSYPRSYGLWQWVGKILSLILLSFGLTYLRRQKVSSLKLFLVLVFLIVIPFSVALLFPAAQPICNPKYLYKITSFTPYLPTIVLFIGGIVLAYRASRSIKVREVLVSSHVEADVL